MKLVGKILVANLVLMSYLAYSQVKAPSQASVAPVAATPVATADTSASAEPVQNNLRIAVVDISVFQQKFLDEVNTKLEAQFKDRQADIQKMVTKFRDDQEKLQKDANIMTAKKLDEAKESLMKQQNDLQVEAKKYDDDLNQKRQQELKTRLDKLMQVVSTISANKYDMVLAKNISLFVEQKYDITDQVKKAYEDLPADKTASNSRIPRKSKNS